MKNRPFLDRAFGDGFTAGLVGFGYVVLAGFLTFGLIAVVVTWEYLWPLYVILAIVVGAAMVIDVIGARHYERRRKHHER